MVHFVIAAVEQMDLRLARVNLRGLAKVGAEWHLRSSQKSVMQSVAYLIAQTPEFGEDIKMNEGINPLRIAVIGCGNRGRGHMRIVHNFEDVDLVAVCDPMESARSRVAHEFKVDRGYAKVEDLLKEVAPDAVIVATPPHLNAEVAQVCLENGFHTLVEKPPGFTVKETEKLRDAAARTGAKAMVGWNRRFHPLIVKAQSLVLERGPITQLVGEFHKSITQLKQSGIFTEQVLDNMFLESPIHGVGCIVRSGWHRSG